MSQLFSVKNKVIIISGATGVLGNAISRHLAREGAQLVILGRNAAKVNDLVKEIKDEGGFAFPAVADVTREEELIEVRKVLESEFDEINGLINAAGGNMPGAVVMPDQFITDLSTEAVKKIMDLNYLGTFLPTKVFLPLMTKNHKGSIINISSMAASRPMTRVMGYASAKAAIDNLTKWMSVEFAKKYGEGMRVNAIAPGFFLTAQNEALLTNKDGSLTERGNLIKDHTPMGRFGQPEELFGAVQWLCSEGSKFITGTIIEVDGGFSAFSGV
ncbi:MAG: SDR family oxidoreductase [Cyclobacteriaceae bacterium]